MRIVQIGFRKFGKFKGTIFDFSPGFNLIFGRNEAGKTTLVDALLVGFFARKRGSRLAGIPKEQRERYGDEVDIWIELEAEGERIRFPKAKNFESDFGIRESEFRSIFLVREGKLEIAEPGRDFKEWWNSLKARFLGFEEEPSKVLRRIAETGEFTETFRLKEEIQSEREKKEDVLNWFKKRQDEIRRLIEDEEKLRQIEEDIKNLDREIALKEKGLKKTKLKKAKEVKIKLDSVKDRLRDYERYEERHRTEWESQENERRRIEEVLKTTKELLSRRSNEAEELAQQLEELKLERERTQQLLLYEKELQDALFRKEELKRAHRVPTPIIGALWGIAGFALITALLMPATWLWVLTILFLIISITATGSLSHQQIKQRRLNSLTERLLKRARDVGIDAGGLEELSQKYEELKEISRDIEDREEERRRIKEEMKQIRKDIEEQAGAAEEITRRLKDLCDRIGLSELDRLKEKLSEKGDLEKEMVQYRAELKGYLGGDEEIWEETLTELETLKDVEPFGDEVEVEELKEKIHKLRGERDELYRFVTAFKAELKAKLDCERPEEVFWKASNLENEIALVEIRRRAGEKIREVFQTVLGSADRLIDEIITQGNATRYFETFTDNNYTSIVLKPQTFSIQVRDRKDKFWDFGRLSTGTRDQLFTAMRIALAEKFLGSKGFLIFDEGFVTSDRIRLRQQMQILGRLVADGWQIYYLTAQDEAKDEVNQLTDIDKKIIEL